MPDSYLGTARALAEPHTLLAVAIGQDSENGQFPEDLTLEIEHPTMALKSLETCAHNGASTPTCSFRPAL